jgi:hypothetical protein
MAQNYIITDSKVILSPERIIAKISNFSDSDSNSDSVVTINTNTLNTFVMYDSDLVDQPFGERYIRGEMILEGVEDGQIKLVGCNIKIRNLFFELQLGNKHRYLFSHVSPKVIQILFDKASNEWVRF